MIVRLTHCFRRYHRYALVFGRGVGCISRTVVRRKASGIATNYLAKIRCEAPSAKRNTWRRRSRSSTKAANDAGRQTGRRGWPPRDGGPKHCGQG